MGFNLLRFLRRVPGAALREYMSAKRIPATESIDWGASSGALVRSVVDVIDTLGPSERDEITADLEQVDKLSSEIRQMTLQSIVAADLDLLGRLRSAESNEFESNCGSVTRPGNVRSRTRTGLRTRPAQWSELERLRCTQCCCPLFRSGGSEGLRECGIGGVLQLDGSGRRLKIDPFEWPILNGDGCADRRSIHFCMYTEGLVETHLEFQGTEPTRRTRRLAHESAISYDPERGRLDVITRGGKAVRAEIARCFARDVLNISDCVQPIFARRFTLNRLKHPYDFPYDAADGIKTVKVFLLRLASRASRNGRITLEVDRSDRTDIYTCCADWFGDADPLHQFEWQVTQAKLRIVFQPEPGRKRQKNVTIDLRVPNGSNLKEQVRHHQLVSQKYLARWGLVIESDA